MGLRDIDLREEYRSDRNDIIKEFFYPCLSNCIEYNRCVDFLSTYTLTSISSKFDNFASGKARLRIVTGHKFRTADLNMLEKTFLERRNLSLDDMLHKNDTAQKFQEIVNKGHISIKIAIPNSEQVAGSFSERNGIFVDEDGQKVAFTGTSREAISTQATDFESVDVFTSWNDKSRVDTKMRDFEDLWANKTKYVEVYDFVHAHEKHLLKFMANWIFEN